MPARNGYTSSGNKKIYRVGKVSISCQRHTYIIIVEADKKAKYRIPKHIHLLSPVCVTYWLQNDRFCSTELTQVKKRGDETHFFLQLFLCYKTYPYICIGKKKKLRHLRFSIGISFG